MIGPTKRGRGMLESGDADRPSPAVSEQAQPDGQRLPKSLFIKTYGCQMNVYDSARMAETLAPLGYRPAEHPAAADMVILNTCHIREGLGEALLRARPAARAASGAAARRPRSRHR